MASLDKIKPNQILHDYHRYKTGHITMTKGKPTAMTKEGHWLVKVLEVDLENRRALCSWNGNREEWWSETRIKRLRVKEKTALPSSAGR